MSNGPGGRVESHFEAEEIMQATDLQVTVTNLGPGNQGSLGPENLAPEARPRIVQELGERKYAKRPTNRWVCGDGRPFEAEAKRIGRHAETDEADPQLIGGIVGSETAAALMEPGQSTPISVLTGDKTDQAIADGQQVTVHGDRKTGKKGCKGNAAMDEGLRFNTENADSVAPVIWAVCQAYGLDAWVSEDDVTEAIANGGQAVNSPNLWDANAEERVAIIVAHGGTYIECVGEHAEAATRVDLTDGAFDKVAWIEDHTTEDGHIIQAFSVSFGHYKVVAFERAQAHGRSQREAALQVMRVYAFNIGISKLLQSREHQVALTSA